MDGIAAGSADGVEAKGRLGGGAQRLVLAPSLRLEHEDGLAVTIYLQSSGTRLRVPRKLYDLLLTFEEPKAVASVAGGDARIVSALARLRESGFLLIEHEVEIPFRERVLTDPAVRLFDCPRYKAAQAADVDVAALGVPWDFGSPASAGARHGPAAIREASMQLLYRTDRRTGAPLGWFDADQGRHILRGVTIGDCGDALVVPGEPQSRMFERISRVVDEVVERGSLPVLLGGDATTAYPVIDIVQRRRPIAIVRIGDVVHSAALPGSSFVSLHALPDRALALKNVSRFVQIGACGRTDDPLGGSRVIPPARLRNEGVSVLEQILEEGTAIHLGLDLASLALPGGGALPSDMDDAGFRYGELSAFIRDLGERHPIASLDVVGMNPFRAGWRSTGMTAVYLLLVALGAALDRKGRTGSS